jgi:hypothetical protein
MRQVLTFLTRIPRLLFIGLVRGYQLLVSPHLPSTCRFQPTCSTYSIQAFREYGAIRGLVLTIYRLGRCHPWGGHGYDPPRWFGETEPESDASMSRPSDATDPVSSESDATREPTAASSPVHSPDE